MVTRFWITLSTECTQKFSTNSIGHKSDSTFAAEIIHQFLYIYTKQCVYNVELVETSRFLSKKSSVEKIIFLVQEISQTNFEESHKFSHFSNVLQTSTVANKSVLITQQRSMKVDKVFFQAWRETRPLQVTLVVFVLRDDSSLGHMRNLCQLLLYGNFCSPSCS